jgi:hypothetical protein
MKLAHGLRHRYLPVVVILVLSSVAMGRAPVFAQTGSATSSAIPSDATPSIGDQIEVEISIDASAVNPPDHRLGSFTGSLDWNPAVLAYNSDSGIMAGFTGVVNVSNVSSGHVVFNGAQPSGATGNVTVLRITFDVVGAGSSVLDLEYSAMAAAVTFESLLPLLTVNDGQVQTQGSPAQYTLAVDVEGSGSVTLNPPGSTYDEGTEVQLTAMPAAGWQFDHWSGDLTGSANPATITLSRNKTITAIFTEESGGTSPFQVFLPYIATDLTATSTESDGNPPVSWVVRPQPTQYNPVFIVTWTGYDPEESGIRCYDVQFRDRHDPWQNWQTCTTATSAKFYGQIGRQYSFRSRATDNAGNVEAWPSEPDTWTYVWPWIWWRR